MTNPKTTATVSQTAEPVIQKKITFREYIKSFLFLTAIYALIINQVQNDKTTSGTSVKEASPLPVKNSMKKNSQQDLPYAMTQAGVSLIFYPVVLWK